MKAQAPASSSASRPKCYQPRHPQHTLLYQTVAEHFETWLALASAGQFDGQGDQRTPQPYVRDAFRKYLACGIFAHGFARARCADCGHDFLVAFSCKGRGVCPSCNTRRMAETAAHLTDHVLPPLPVRQWVLSVPKRLRYFMQRDAKLLDSVLALFVRVVAQSLKAHAELQSAQSAMHIGAVAFIHRFGSSLNLHVHFHVCVLDGVFEVEGDRGGDEAVPSSKRLSFSSSSINASTLIEVQTQVAADVRRRILRIFVARGLLDRGEMQDMLAWRHSGFSVDAGVRIESEDRAGLERLLRYCARPPFAQERLRKAGAKLEYRCANEQGERHAERRQTTGQGQRGAVVDKLLLTPLELIDRIAALIPPPRKHRHRYFGVLAANSPWRAAVVGWDAAGQAMPEPVQQPVLQPAATGAAEKEPSSTTPIAPIEAQAGKRSPSHYLWAVLIGRIYESFPLLCPMCGGAMRLIAFITDGPEVTKILEHIGAEPEPPVIARARGPQSQEAPDDEGDQGIEE